MTDQEKFEIILRRLQRLERKADITARTAIMALYLVAGVVTFAGAYILGIHHWDEGMIWFRLALCGGGAFAIAWAVRRHLTNEYQGANNL